MEKVLLRVCEAAELAGVCRSTGYQLAASGEWPTVRIGRSVRVHGPGLLAWIEARVQNKQSLSGQASVEDPLCELHSGPVR